MRTNIMNDDHIIQQTLDRLNQWDLKARGAYISFALFIMDEFKMDERRAHHLLNEVYKAGLLNKLRDHDYNLTDLGRRVCERENGWIEFKKEQQKKILAERQKQEHKEQLEIEKSEREIEKLRYERSIRQKEELIKELNLQMQRQALELQKVNNELQKANNKVTWSGAIIGAIIGAIATLIAAIAT